LEVVDVSGKAEGRRCAFVWDWTCHVEAEDIPLDVCRMCLEARRLRIEEASRVVKRIVGVVEPSKPSEPVLDAEALMKALSKIDKMFEEGEIDLEEYVRRRGEVLRMVEALQRPP
jgi:hypothetical protein